MKPSVTARAAESHNLFLRLQEALRLGTVSWLASGEFLAKLKKDNRFRDILGDPPAGHQWSFGDFLSQPEIAIPESTAAKFIAMYQTFRERLRLSDRALGAIRFYRLKALAPHITEKNQKELLDAAEHLDRNGFESALVKASRGINQDECQHEWERCIFERCSKCDKRRVRK